MKLGPARFRSFFELLDAYPQRRLPLPYKPRPLPPVPPPLPPAFPALETIEHKRRVKAMQEYQRRRAALVELLANREKG